MNWDERGIKKLKIYPDEAAPYGLKLSIEEKFLSAKREEIIPFSLTGT